VAPEANVPATTVAEGAAAPAVRLLRREDWRPYAWDIDAVALEFDLDAQSTQVRSTLQVRRRGDAAPGEPLVLAGRGVELQGVWLNGEPLDPSGWRLDSEGLRLDGLPGNCTLRLDTTVQPASNRSGRGLFVLDGTLVTQMEPEGMSRVTFFPDRPDVMARYRVTLRADRAAHPVLLSNGQCVARRDMPDGRHEAVWEDPFRKPSYVFGLVAGDLASLHGRCRFASGREVQLAVYAPRRHVQRCRFALGALQRAMLWDEATYGLECDVSEFSLVALHGFPGAMENKGLNLFDLSGVVADPDLTTDDEALTIERIIAHEYFHNWTGNRVTCRDWFQLSLKEGLTRLRDQCYMDDRLGGVYRLDVVRALMRNQFPEDDGPNRHPIRPERYADVEELYTATVYDKGAEVLRMLRTLLGGEPFVAGVRAYLQACDGEAVTTDRFLDEMARASGRDLAPLRRWYATAGRPQVRVERRSEGARQLLRLEQLPPPGAADTPLPIPVRVRWIDPRGVPLAPRRVDDGDPELIVLTDQRYEVAYDGLPPDAVPSLFEGFSAPVDIAPHLSASERRVLVLHATDPWARWRAAQSLMVDALRAQARVVHAGATPAFEPALLDTLGGLLERALADPGQSMISAELLRVPDEPVLSQGLAEIDVDGHHAARMALRATLGRTLRPQLLAALAPPATDDAPLMHPQGMGRRRLAAVCLDLLAATGDAEVAQLCHDRALHAPTMTERFDALACIVDLDHPLRQAALDAFIARWQDEPTVVAKWFTAQALARGADAVDRIKALQAHPHFDPTHITLGMALYGSFFRQNRVAFHDAGGRGYEWLADTLLALDRMGRPGGVWLTPQIAQWRRHAAPRRLLMQSALQRVASEPGLSNGMRGLVQRLLAD
jgi:aminopeptidase N